MLKEVFWAHICCEEILACGIKRRKQQGPVWGAPFRIFVWDCWTVAGIVSLRVGPKGRVEDGGGGRK